MTSLIRQSSQGSLAETSAGKISRKLCMYRVTEAKNLRKQRTESVMRDFFIFSCTKSHLVFNIEQSPVLK